MNWATNIIPTTVSIAMTPRRCPEYVDEGNTPAALAKKARKDTAFGGIEAAYRIGSELVVRYTEIAARMNRSERAVHMLCNRGLKKLRAALGHASQYLTRG